MVMVMVMVMVGGTGRFAKVAQLQAIELLYGQRRGRATGQRLGEEAFQVRADPVEQLGLLQLAHVRGAQGKVVRRGARRQQHLGLPEAVLYGGGNQLQWLDAGQYAHVSQCLAAGEKEGGKGKEATHDGNTWAVKRNRITSLRHCRRPHRP